jgi:hypothetical protein
MTGLGQMTQDTYGKPYLHTFLAFPNNTVRFTIDTQVQAIVKLEKLHK